MMAASMPRIATIISISTNVKAGFELKFKSFLQLKFKNSKLKNVAICDCLGCWVDFSFFDSIFLSVSIQFKIKS